MCSYAYYLNVREHSFLTYVKLLKAKKGKPSEF